MYTSKIVCKRNSQIATHKSWRICILPATQGPLCLIFVFLPRQAFTLLSSQFEEYVLSSVPHNVFCRAFEQSLRHLGSFVLSGLIGNCKNQTTICINNRLKNVIKHFWNIGRYLLTCCIMSFSHTFHSLNWCHKLYSHRASAFTYYILLHFQFISYRHSHTFSCTYFKFIQFIPSVQFTDFIHFLQSFQTLLPL